VNKSQLIDKIAAGADISKALLLKSVLPVLVATHKQVKKLPLLPLKYRASVQVKR